MLEAFGFEAVKKSIPAMQLDRLYKLQHQYFLRNRYKSMFCYGVDTGEYVWEDEAGGVDGGEFIHFRSGVGLHCDTCSWLMEGGVVKDCRVGRMVLMVRGDQDERMCNSDGERERMLRCFWRIAIVSTV